MIFFVCIFYSGSHLLKMYYRNASAAIVCFDITNEDSFTKMKDWVEELKQNVFFLSLNLMRIYLLACSIAGAFRPNYLGNSLHQVRLGFRTSGIEKPS